MFCLRHLEREKAEDTEDLSEGTKMRIAVLFFSVCLIGCGPSKEEKLKAAMLEVDRLLTLKNKTAEIAAEQELNILTETRKYESYLQDIQDTIKQFNDRVEFSKETLSMYDGFIKSQMVAIKILEDRIAYYQERANGTLFPARYTPIIEENQDKLKDERERLKKLQKTRAKQAEIVATRIDAGVKYRESKNPEMGDKFADHTLKMGKMKRDYERIKSAFDSLSALHTDAVFRLSSLKADH